MKMILSLLRLLLAAQMRAQGSSGLSSVTSSAPESEHGRCEQQTTVYDLAQSIKHLSADVNGSWSNDAVREEFVRSCSCAVQWSNDTSCHGSAQGWPAASTARHKALCD
jgi:hypothetical protein